MIIIETFWRGHSQSTVHTGSTSNQDGHLMMPAPSIRHRIDHLHSGSLSPGSAPACIARPAVRRHGGLRARCGATMQAGALPGESEPEWRWSDAVADRWCRHHEVSILIAGGTGVDGALAVSAQEGLDDDHAAAGSRGKDAVVVLAPRAWRLGSFDGIDRDERTASKLAGTSDILGAGLAGEQAV